jgi:GH15 family glucan-1,4-alpha-glucosidase
MRIFTAQHDQRSGVEMPRNLTDTSQSPVLACSFWLAVVYQMMGRAEDARRLFERAASTCNDVGLLAEEYDTKNQRQLGNFPQAFSHFALVNAAFALADGISMVHA